MEQSQRTADVPSRTDGDFLPRSGKLPICNQETIPNPIVELDIAQSQIGSAKRLVGKDSVLKPLHKLRCRLVREYLRCYCVRRLNTKKNKRKSQINCHYSFATNSTAAIEKRLPVDKCSFIPNKSGDIEGPFQTRPTVHGGVNT